MNPPKLRRCAVFALFFAVMSTAPRAAAIDFSATGAEIRVSQETTGLQWTPRIARLTDGRVVAVWEDQGYIKARIFNADSSPAGLDFRVDQMPYASVLNFTPDVAALPGGGFVVTWQGYVNPTVSVDVFARAFDGDFNPIGNTFRLDEDNVGNQNLSQVEVFDDGTILFAWQQNSGSPTFWDIKYRLFHPDLTPVGDEAQLATTLADDQFRVEFARLGDGSIVAVWDSEEFDGEANVRARRVGPLGPLGDDILVNTSEAGDQYDASVAAVGSSGFVVCWTHDPVVGDVANERGEIRFQRFTFDTNTDEITPAGTETEVNTVTTGSQIESSVSGWNGGFVVSWTSENNLRYSGDTDIATGQDGDGAGVYARGYDDAGVAQAVPFRINTTVTNHQYQPTTAALNGFAMIAWTSKGQDGDNDGVYLRRIQTNSGFVPADPDPGDGNPTQPVPPTLSMTVPGALVFKADRNGKFPPAKVYQLRNTGDSTLSWLVSGKPPWIQVSPRSGSLAADQSTGIRVSVIRAKLPKKGSKARGSIAFDATGTGVGDRSIRVLVQLPKAKR